MTEPRVGATTSTGDRELVTSRVYRARRERVFKAFADPRHLVHWWGPKRFTNTFNEFDLRAGDAWRFVMHGPDGVDSPDECKRIARFAVEANEQNLDRLGAEPARVE